MTPPKKRRYHQQPTSLKVIVPLNVILWMQDFNEKEKYAREHKKKLPRHLPPVSLANVAEEKIPLDRQNKGQERRDRVRNATLTVTSPGGELCIVYKKGQRPHRTKELRIGFIPTRDALADAVQSAVKKDGYSTFDYERLSIEYKDLFWNAVYHFKKSPEAINEWMQKELGFMAPSSKRRRKMQCPVQK